MVEFISSLPVGPVPIIVTILSFYAVGRLLFYPARRWRASTGLTFLAIYGCAMFGSLVWLFVFSVTRQLFGFQLPRSVAYLIGTVLVMVFAELIDRFIKSRRGIAPIADVIWKRFQQQTRDTMRLAAGFGIIAAIAFTLIVWKLPERTIPDNYSLERNAFFVGNSRYIYGVGWAFTGMGMFFHICFITTLRLLGFSRGKDNG